MSSQTLPEISALQREPSWIAPWRALREYQDGVFKLWRMSLSAWPFYLPAVRPQETDSLLPQQGRSTDLAPSNAELEGSAPRRKEEPVCNCR